MIVAVFLASLDIYGALVAFLEKARFNPKEVGTSLVQVRFGKVGLVCVKLMHRYLESPKSFRYPKCRNPEP